MELARHGAKPPCESNYELDGDCVYCPSAPTRRAITPAHSPLMNCFPLNYALWNPRGQTFLRCDFCPWLKDQSDGSTQRAPPTCTISTSRRVGKVSSSIEGNVLGGRSEARGNHENHERQIFFCAV